MHPQGLDLDLEVSLQEDLDLELDFVYILNSWKNRFLSKADRRSFLVLLTNLAERSAATIQKHFTSVLIICSHSLAFSCHSNKAFSC